jgi:hypothetical protein
VRQPARAARHGAAREARAERVQRHVDLARVLKPQAEVARGGVLADVVGGVDVEQQPARVVPLGRVRVVARVGLREAPDRCQLAVLPAARIAGGGQVAGADVDQLERLGRRALVERVAKQALVGDREARLELVREQREGLERRERVGPFVRV